MKFARTFLFILLLPITWACHGTEVGNGRSRPSPQANNSPDGQKDSPGDTSSESPTKPDIDGGTESDPTSGDNAISVRDHLFVACASPFAEITTGTFAESQGTDELIVSSGGANQWTATFGSTTRTVTPLITAAKPYGLASDNAVSSLLCKSVVSEARKRTVTFSDDMSIIWTLDDSDAVITIEVFTSDGMLELSYERL